MQIFRTLAGYSLGRADLVRRAMSKKKHDVMLKEREIFINGLISEDGTVEVEGCIRRGVDRETAESVYEEMKSFASYAFNKSHAASYAYISYQTAWLKYHYPREYMAALLSSVLDNQNKMAGYITDCHRMGIQVLPPHVNYSFHGFTVSDGNIRYGLMAIKNLGKNFIDSIIELRSEKPFESLKDFCSRLYSRGMNSRALESLIKCGALDNLGANRRQMLTVSKAVMEDIEFEKRRNMDGQMSLFEASSDAYESAGVRIPDLEEFSLTDLLAMEKDMAGMYLSGHPLLEFEWYADKVKADRIGDIIASDGDNTLFDNHSVRIVAIVSRLRTQITKSNQMMAFVTAEDRSGSIELIVFPKTLTAVNPLLYPGSVIAVTGTLSIREDEDPKILVNAVEQVRKSPDSQSGERITAPTSYDSIRSSVERPVVSGRAPEAALDIQKANSLYIKVPSKESAEFEIAKRLIDIFDGNTPVYFYLENDKKVLRAPSDLWVELNDVLLNELKNRLGEDNIRLK